MAKTSVLLALEHSLREFILEDYESDARERDNFNAFKYRGLTITLGDIRKSHVPIFTVQVGMLEADFDIDSGKKIGGGLAKNDERLIELWLDKNANRRLLRLAWEEGTKVEAKFLKIKPFDVY